jgi:hypothetical protein
MSMEIVTIIVSGAAASAFASVGGTLLSLYQNWKSQRDKLSRSNEINLEDVLNSNDIKRLGRFLDETIGQFDVAEYVTSKNVSNTIDKYFDGVSDFLGSAARTEAEEKIEKPEPSNIYVSHKRPDFSGNLEIVFSELEQGEIWNGLARLRREIEIKLRERALELGYKKHHLRSAGQILRILIDRNVIRPDLAKPLQYAIAVCNRAVHGREVSFGEAEEALMLTRYAMDKLDAEV